MRNRTLFFCISLLLILSACARQEAPRPTQINTSEAPATVSVINPSPTLTTRTSAASNTPVPTLTPAPTADALPFMGIEVNSMDQAPQAERFRESGAEWSRDDYIHWEDIEPANVDASEFDWSKVKEDALLAAVEGGQKTIANILFTPTWAQKYPGIACGQIAEAALDDFAEFMSAAVSRYSVPPYNVKYWEIGNEPDIDRTLVSGRSGYGCWGEAGDPYYGGGYYAEMLKAVYPAIKAADPESKLIVGGLVLDCDPVNPPETAPGSGELRDCSSTRFLEGIFEAGGGDYLDGISFHAYDYYYGEEGLYGNAGWHSSSDTTGPVLIAKTHYLRSLLNAYSYPDKELLNTELAVLCGRDGKEEFCQGDDFANTKANYVSQANASALAEGLDVNLWYSLTGWRGSSLVDENAEPLPAFKSYQYAAAQLNQAVYQGRIDDYAGILGYEFMMNGRTIWVMWSVDGEDHIVNFPGTPSAVYDVFGEPVPLNSSSGGEELEVSTAPVYIEWSP